MKKNAGDICFFAGLALAFVIQAACGDFPEEVFAFPVNAAVLFFSVVLLVVLHREKPSSGLCRYLASARTSLILFVCLALSCLILGLFSQTGGDLLGFRHVKYSWWFVYLMTAFMANILMVLITRPFRLRFLREPRRGLCSRNAGRRRDGSCQNRFRADSGGGRQGTGLPVPAFVYRYSIYAQRGQTINKEICKGDKQK